MKVFGVFLSLVLGAQLSLATTLNENAYDEFQSDGTYGAGDLRYAVGRDRDASGSSGGTWTPAWGPTGKNDKAFAVALYTFNFSPSSYGGEDFDGNDSDAVVFTDWNLCYNISTSDSCVAAEDTTSKGSWKGFAGNIERANAHSNAWAANFHAHCVNAYWDEEGDDPSMEGSCSCGSVSAQDASWDNGGCGYEYGGLPAAEDAELCRTTAESGWPTKKKNCYQAFRDACNASDCSAKHAAAESFKGAVRVED